MKRLVAVFTICFGFAAVFASPAQADPLVTYSWTTTNKGFGSHVDQPSSATFQVPLSDVLSGAIPFFDVSNTQLFYPGLTFDTATVSITGFDFAAFVNPVTGAFIFHDAQQGFAVIASDSRDPTFSTFLSITVDNPFDPLGHPLTSVADQFNALNHGQPFAGFPTGGFWTANFPNVTPVPLPGTLPFFLTGLGAIGLLGWRRKKKLAA